MKQWTGNKSTFRSHITYCLLQALNTLRTQLKELKHYAFINAEGFRKIIKKYDKRLSTKTLSSYLVTFNKCGFYKHAQLNLMIHGIDQIVDKSGNKSVSSNRTAINALIREADREWELDAVANINSRNLSTLLESSQNEKISTLFINAVRANKFEAVECIVEYFVNADDAANNNDNDHLAFLINARGYLGNTSLMTCCAVFGSMKIARLLLKHGADISLQNSYCRTALHIAAQRGHMEILQLLLTTMEQRGEEDLIHELDKDMNNALHLGCLRRQYAACRVLIECNSNVVNQQNADGATPLMIACSDRDTKHPQEKQVLLECMMKECANINQRDWNMQSALHYACNSEDELVVDLLLKSKINPFVFDRNGMCPLHIAAQQGQANMVRKICEYCTSYSGHEWQSTVPIVDHTDNRGRTPLHLAAGKGFSEITKYLISVGANTKMLDDNRCNAHSYAWFNGIWTDECPSQLIADKDEEHKSISNEHDDDLPAVNVPPPTAKMPVHGFCPIDVVAFMEPAKSLGSSASSSVKPSQHHQHNGATSGCIVRFRIQCDTSSAQYLCILGDCDELGNWDVTRAVRMYENKMPSRVVTTDEETDYTDTEQQKEMERKKKEEEESERDQLKTWIGEVVFTPGTAIQYRYIVRVQSSLQSWESLPTQRSATIYESLIIDDGVFGQSPSLINRLQSCPHGLSKLDQMDDPVSPTFAAMPNTQNYSESMRNFTPSPAPQLLNSSTSTAMNGTHSSKEATSGGMNRERGGSRNQREELRRYIRSGYLASDAQLQLRLGHVTAPQKKPPLIINNNIYIDRIVIRSGYINTNRYRGIHVNVALPLGEEDKLKVFKFQSHHKQINSLCSLEFEFYPRSGPALARVFVLPSQILSNDSGRFTLALLSSSNDQRGGLLIGEFNFEYTLIKPFHHESCGNILHKTFQHKSEYNKTILIGHRGVGGHNSAKLPGPRRTHIQENTILAFNTAQTFGADFVEFDVQLTKDKVPVIYHDFLFHTKFGFHIPINKVTYEELQKYNMNNFKTRSPANAGASGLGNGNGASKKKRKQRTFIGNNLDESEKEADNNNNNGDSGGAKEKVTKTPSTIHKKASSQTHLMGKQKSRTPVPGKGRSVKGPHHTPNMNAKSHSFTKARRADSEQSLEAEEFESFLNDNICSLADVFEMAPVDLGLNIEIKYPLYEERVEDGVENVVDLNDYCDRILQVVFDHDSSQRYIIFSSFHPDICKLIQLKQPQFPVLLLTEGGKHLYSDGRCNSLRNAIQMARSHSLFGVVTNVSAILKAPHLIDVVHENGLILLSYGSENNDTEQVDVQMAYGIDGLISDHIQHIRGHLDTIEKGSSSKPLGGLPTLPPPSNGIELGAAKH